MAVWIAESAGLEFPQYESCLQYPVAPEGRAYLAIDGVPYVGQG